MTKPLWACKACGSTLVYLIVHHPLNALEASPEALQTPVCHTCDQLVDVERRHYEDDFKETPPTQH